MILSEFIDSIDPRQLWIAAIALTALTLGWIISFLLHRRGLTSPKMHHELMLRIRTWGIIIPATVIPILIGPAGITAAVLLLGFVCYREFSRATGLEGDHLLFASVMVGLLVVAIAILKHDQQLLLLSAPLVAVLTTAASLVKDQPEGYLRRIALTNLGFMLCGLWPGHLGFMGSGQINGTILLWFILCIELNDVFAFVAGKTFGRTALCPHTSPGKTCGGLIGAMILTTMFVSISGWLLFQGQALGNLLILIPIGILLSLAGSAGDLILSSIKRDLHLKDLSNSLPGHGGILDRCDSLIFAAPVFALILGVIDSFQPLQHLTAQLP
ncbi:phosphatidate cytidylyltransferase [bacterium]|nr:phosphatidate cytidylyltransferase [bacterium]